ncbi:prephenate dehydrogenase [Haloferula helveola]|uniref:Prephenate dehydrogenase n=1 Tax=Haloferula helveola TaxID=490095 RepID=A0ABN6H8S0_9BACT|nr:prephenate dehydrogenase [Haloferula helveola]
MEFNKVAILGGGLLGGSLALRLQGMTEVTLWARREESVEKARELGVAISTTDLKEAVAGADLVVLSVPVGVMPELVTRAIDEGLPDDALLTDVGSVKSAVHQSLRSVLEGRKFRFIGGHPMAGSETQGIGSATSDLFDGAMCLLTDDDKVGDPSVGRLESFWRAVGCRVRWMDAAAHDELVARISHFPHVMAAATAMVGLETPGDARFGGGGLRDTTRVASGDPAMWAEILMENATAVSASVRQAGEALGEMLAMLERGDHEALLGWLELARDRHQAGREQQHDEFE